MIIVTTISAITFEFPPFSIFYIFSYIRSTQIKKPTSRKLFVAPNNLGLTRPRPPPPPLRTFWGALIAILDLSWFCVAGSEAVFIFEAVIIFEVTFISKVIFNFEDLFIFQVIFILEVVSIFEVVFISEIFLIFEVVFIC